MVTVRRFGSLTVLTMAIMLAGCNGNDHDIAGASPTPTALAVNTVTITPSLGRIQNARAIIRNARTGVELANRLLGSNGSVQMQIPKSVDAVVVEIKTDTGSQYFDEAKGIQPLPADFRMRTAGRINGNTPLGVTVLTEAAVQLAEALPDGLTKPANIDSALDKVGKAVGIDNINLPPTPISADSDYAALKNTPADQYALQLAGLVKAAAEHTASLTPALELVNSLAKDLSDGQVDGKAGAAVIASPPYPTLPLVFAEAWKFGMEDALDAMPEGDLKNQLRTDVVDAAEVQDVTTGPVVTDDTDFGSNAGKWKGEIYLLPIGTPQLPDFSLLTPIGALYTSEINITPRSFTDPFPGVPSNRFEWFGVRYQGPLTIQATGDYSFSTLSDDGSKLYIDDQLIINNDGQHAPSSSGVNTIALSKGVHTLRIEYFQGPATQIALQVYGYKAGSPQQLLTPVL
ncbi:PA14 domain-containing protein [Fluviicoccus keumensis]|uniref:PA14 domain-containing protein n=1 Tax=Fluviicoccus keumensis TaxID=1435465 RepID=A0A4Q7ZAY2_9GAMM|nr:PA14 domain-containing protein [Fluviicoccus keumensis]RZU47757.1 PA14 domain-containing protein [Fluviicoccus keumensis]